MILKIGLIGGHYFRLLLSNRDFKVLTCDFSSMRKLRKYLTDNNYIIVLTYVTIIVGFLHFITDDVGIEIWLKQFSANLFTTIIGIWITVLCIDQIIKKKEQRERNRFLNIAYLEISRALNFYLFYLNRIYKVSSKEKPVFKETYDEMYNSEHFRDAFMNCDFTRNAEYSNCTWGQFIHSKTEDLINIVDLIISKYSFILDVDTLSRLELLKGSPWLLVSSQMENPEGKRDVIYKYYNEFLNQLFIIAKIITVISNNPRYSLFYDNGSWDDSSFDKIGSARLTNYSFENS
ncbi:hypothetical protein [Alistipes sp.]|nr:hypothetical protein [Alistipes sp.]